MKNDSRRSYIRRALRSITPYGIVSARRKHKKTDTRRDFHDNLSGTTQAVSQSLSKDEKAARKEESIFNSEPSNAWKKKYEKYCRTENIENTWILYESHAGSGMVCNPWALFAAFMERDDFETYQHIWVLADEDELRLQQENYREYDNVRFVYYNSPGYAYCLAKSKYLINNTSFVSVFAKRPGQIYVDTWHSTTVKALGFDMPDGKIYVKNMLRNLLMADYIVSPNPFMTGIYNESFKLHELYEGMIIEEGFPRNDRELNCDRQEIIKKLEEHGTKIDPSKKVVLYAPTWNGSNTGRPLIDTQRYEDMGAKLSGPLEEGGYQLLIKPHQIEYRNLSNDQRASGNYVSYAIDANELLSIVDILITDYSSIFFDYLVSDKPILFYVPNLAEYSEARGLCFRIGELPGPVCKNLDELAYQFSSLSNSELQYKTRRSVFRKTYCAQDDGHASERILKVIFDDDKKYNLVGAEKHGKIKLLMYVGGLSTNGVTAAAQSLLNNINYDKYDVTVLVFSLKGEAQREQFLRINTKVRTVLRTSTPILTGLGKTAYSECSRSGMLMPGDELDALHKIMRKEYVRNLGNVEFDAIIDFSGYGSLFPVFSFLGVPNIDRIPFIIWQHNDMYEEFADQRKGQLARRSLSYPALEDLYGRADAIVSCTEAVMKKNRDNFSSSANRDVFAFATNMLDADRYKKLILATPVVDEKNELLVMDESREEYLDRRDLVSVPWREGRIRFVTMGRYMPEKNHEALIRGFSGLIKDGVDADLYLIGDGPLRKTYQEVAAHADIEDRVVLVGNLKNPFALMKKCDCFVFPSLREGQGLSALEAKCAGLPILVSPFSAVGSILTGSGEVILSGFGEQDIYAGMRAFVDGKVSSPAVFDVDAYNRKAIKEFDDVIETAIKRKARS